MTKQKHRKRRARDLAAKNSLSYTTANRIVSSRGAQQVGIQSPKSIVAQSAPLFPTAQPWNPLIITTARDAADLVARALALEPNLTHFGVGLYGGERARLKLLGDSSALADYDAKFAAEQGALYIHLVEVAAAADWIRRQPLIKTINERDTSYTYKHDVERWFRSRNASLYIANGSFLAAALGLGIVGKRSGIDSPNMYFSFSRVGLKATRTAVRQAEAAPVN